MNLKDRLRPSRHWRIQKQLRIIGLAAFAGLCGCSGSHPAAPPSATAPVLSAPAAGRNPQNDDIQTQNAAQSSKSSRQQAIAQLIAQVEAELAQGQASYRAGQLTQAKKHFDAAVDTMLAGNLDIRSNAQLLDEYNHALDVVNGLEMEALKQGNGFAPAEEPTPADVANDVTFAVDPNLVARARANLATTRSDLPLVINDYVAAFINFFSNTKIGHNTLKHSLERSGKYRAMIQRVMAEEGVPQDLIYLAVAESGFQPQVVNRGSGAGGMWQFMPHGNYGLVRNSYVDERFDPEKSTRAYARYMKFLYDQLGDWYLAMAAYDWGAGNVQRAVQKTGYADYWELYKRNNLPGETKNYVPEILAAIIIANNRKQYGFDDIQPDTPIVSDIVKIDYSLDLRLAADIVNADPRELAVLNPSLLRMVTPPASMLSEPFELHLPPGTAVAFQAKIERIPVEHRTAWRYHTVSAEDTLASVARSYRVRVEELAKANHLQANDTLEGVEALVIPAAPTAPTRRRVTYYRAHRGDTLVTIADRFGISLSDLRRWNHLSGTRVVSGQRIRVAEPVATAQTRSSRGSATHPARRRTAPSSSTHSTSAHAAGKKITAAKTLPSSRKSKRSTSVPSSTKKKKVQK